MTIIKHRDIRGLLGTMCGACIVTLVALGFSAAPARAQSVPTCVAIDFFNRGDLAFDGNPAPQNSSIQLVALVKGVSSLGSSCDLSGSFRGAGTYTLFASVDSNNVQTSCAAGTASKQITTNAVEEVVTFFDLDTSTVGTFGYEVAYSGESGKFDPSVSPCVDFVVTASPCPVRIGVLLAGGDGMPLAGTTNEWLVALDVHACQDVTDLKVQGGTPGWETGTTIANPGFINPTVGTATVKNNNKNQVITWTMTELGQGADASLQLNISATIKPKITPFTILELLGSSWSLSYKLADGVQQTTSLAGTVTVQVMPPME